MVEAKTVGIIGILALLAGFGGSLLLTPTQQENTYVCTSTEQIGIFYGGISSTGLTAYPYVENRSNSVRCTNGKWVKLSEYAKNHTVDFTKPQVGGIQYSCNQKTCVKI